METSNRQVTDDTAVNIDRAQHDAARNVTIIYWLFSETHRKAIGFLEYLPISRLADRLLPIVN